MSLNIGKYKFSHLTLLKRFGDILNAIFPNTIAEDRRRQTVRRLKWLAGELDLPNRLKIVDVGANPMDFDAPYKTLLDAGLCDVLGFEPQEEPFNKLLVQKGDQETYVKAAIGDGSERPFYQYPSDPLSSVYPLDNKAKNTIGFLNNAEDSAFQPVSDQPVQTRRIDDIDEIFEIDFFKIDIQGGELMVLENAREKLAQAMAVQTEMRFFKIYKNEPCFGEVDCELTAQGFEIHSLFDGPTRHPIPNSQSRCLSGRGAKQLLDNDFIYVRNLRDLGLYSADKLKKLAILADGVFESTHLVIACLDKLVEAGHVPKDLSSSYWKKLPARYKS